MFWSNRDQRGVLTTPSVGVVLAGFLVLVGAAALAPLWIHISREWWADPLRVIGAAFPAISFLGVLGAWKRLNWRLDGSLWGLVPIALAIQMAKFVNVAPFSGFLGGQYLREVHPGPVLLLYGAGAALLFGGWGLVRAAILPLCLLLCINPVPLAFNVHFDLPLQRLSAGTARAFAHLIGLHPTGEQLRMMFTPDFGMLIVPGCNGVRGSVTLAYLALIYGYTRRLPLRTLLPVSFAALLIGYAMNLTRLCLLVLYYRVGMSVTSIQPYGTQIDYVIGCFVFLTGTTGLGFLVRALEPKTPEGAAERAEAAPEPGARILSRAAMLRAVCFAVLTLVPIVQARALFSPSVWRPASEQQVLGELPKAVGEYALVRSYTERQYGAGGAPTLVLGEYAAPTAADGEPRRVTLGLYVSSGYHRVYDSKSVRGELPVWTNAFAASAPGARPVPMGVSLYDDGTSRSFTAETNCTESACSNPLQTYEQFKASDYLGSAAGNHLPILVRMEWPDSDPRPTPALYAEFQANVRALVGGLDVKSLVAKVGRPLD